MTVWRKVVAGATLIVGGVWFAASFGYIGISSKASAGIRLAFLLLWAIACTMDWRTRKNQPLEEPSPAHSARNVILMTGLVAVMMTSRNARSPVEYVIPAAIAIIAVVLAFAASRFATKNRDQIGEARFDTTSTGR